VPAVIEYVDLIGAHEDSPIGSHLTLRYWECVPEQAPRGSDNLLGMRDALTPYGTAIWPPSEVTRRPWLGRVS
jgi:hypothetical protein